MGHVPIHCVYMKSDLVQGHFKIAVQPSLPVNGIEVILGNDIAGWFSYACIGRFWHPTVNLWVKGA